MAKLTDLPIITALEPTDLVYAVDVSDQTDDPAGSSVAISYSDLAQVAWAHVDTDGTLLAGAGIASVVKGATGVYTVNFSRAATTADTQAIQLTAINFVALIDMVASLPTTTQTSVGIWHNSVSADGPFYLTRHYT